MGERCPNERGAGAGGRGAGGRHRQGSRRRPAGADRRRRTGCRPAVSGVLCGADREREDAGGVRAGGGAVSDLVRGPRPRPGRDRLSRPLGELDLRVVCIDGKVFRDHCMVVALGIDTQGRKHVLGLRERATETAVVTSGLLSDLVTRGLPTDRTLLFVIDGAPGLRRAITDVFGSLGVVQRCQVHKLRNVLGHLPERLHASVGKALRDAWDLESADRAARVLKRLAGSLERDHPGAAASIREGLEETLTVQRLGLTGSLERTLRTTNIIENLMGSVEGYTRRVKRWRGGQMIQRWVASALVEAEPRFRRVRGYRDLRYLVGALDALAPPDGAVADVA